VICTHGPPRVWTAAQPGADEPRGARLVSDVMFRRATSSFTRSHERAMYDEAGVFEVHRPALLALGARFGAGARPWLQRSASAADDVRQRGASR
jgi:hypothetical protein